MTIKVAINGYGRIGRNIMRALHEYGWLDRIEIVAINDLGDAATNAHLTKYDTAHGIFAGDVSVDGGDLIVNGHRVKVLAERDPAALPWAELGVDVLAELTLRPRLRSADIAHERDIIVERTQAGLAAARARGRRGGRPKAMDASKASIARKMYESREHTVTDIAKTLGVSRATVYRCLEPKAATAGRTKGKSEFT